jgi:hypothetical protein
LVDGFAIRPLRNSVTSVNFVPVFEIWLIIKQLSG